MWEKNFGSEIQMDGCMWEVLIFMSSGISCSHWRVGLNLLVSALWWLLTELEKFWNPRRPLFLIRSWGWCWSSWCKKCDSLSLLKCRKKLCHLRPWKLILGACGVLSVEQFLIFVLNITAKVLTVVQWHDSTNLTVTLLRHVQETMHDYLPFRSFKRNRTTRPVRMYEYTFLLKAR